ncbi:transcriptional regulator, XRE family [Burkholderia pseudomallei MSHR1357]|nr:transcriptional regulator, XRE family [Burkholderia pseudomallei MSHR1357]
MTRFDNESFTIRHETFGAPVPDCPTGAARHATRSNSIREVRCGTQKPVTRWCFRHASIRSAKFIACARNRIRAKCRPLA